MVIQHKEKENHGVFFIEDENEIVAELVYAITDPGQMIIEHTEVDESMKGTNLGFELIQHAVEYARRHYLKITPVCLFAKAIFDRKPDFQDVLASA